MFDDPLTVFDGDKDKNSERTMLFKAGGQNTIRTVINDLPDRTEMLRTRGGFPELTTTKKAGYVSPTKVTGWVETDFNLRQYGDPVITRLSPAMGGFLALVKPIVSINIDGAIEGNFDFKPHPKIETNLP